MTITVDPLPMPFPLAIMFGALAALGIVTVGLAEVIAYRAAERRRRMWWRMR